MKFISLFAGVGGFDLALERQGHECVYVNEWDKYSAITYEKNFRRKPDTRSITDVPADELPSADLIVGGFPCQAFSIAGKRRGFEDTRGTLFYEIARILKAKRIPLVLLENVKGLLSHDRGETFRTIITALDELGYDIQWQVLNSKNFGVPQNRERVFIVGHLRGTPRPQVFPIGDGNENDIEQTKELREQNSNTLRTNYGRATSNETYIAEIKQMNNPTHSNDRVYSKDGISPTLNTMQGGRRQPKIQIPKKKVRTGNPTVEEIQPYLRGWLKKSQKTISEIERIFNNRAPHHWFEKIKFASLPDVDDWIKLKEILGFDNKHDKLMTDHRLMTEWEIMQEHKTRHQEKGNGFGVVMKDPKGISGTLTAFSDRTDALEVQGMIRRLTPVECERLQGFPDNWTEGVSDTQRYKQMGNAVTVNVVEAIIKHL